MEVNRHLPSVLTGSACLLSFIRQPVTFHHQDINTQKENFKNDQNGLSRLEVQSKVICVYPGCFWNARLYCLFWPHTSSTTTCVKYKQLLPSYPSSTTLQYVKARKCYDLMSNHGWVFRVLQLLLELTDHHPCFPVLIHGFSARAIPSSCNSFVKLTLPQRFQSFSLVILFPCS